MEVSGEDPGGTENNCFKCKAVFDDAKGTVQCTMCKYYYHGKCENVDFRGFHLRRATWRCKQCSDVHGDGQNEAQTARPRKRSRIDDCDDQSLIEGMSITLGMLLRTTNALNQKMDQLLDENKLLKLEITKLKESQSVNNTATCPNTSYASIAAGQPNNNKVLLVKQKGQQKDVKQIKKDLQNKVNPGELGVGVSMGRATRDGGLILSCGNEREISTVQSEIQSKLGENYEVDRPKIHDHRIKAVGIDECEYGDSDEIIIDKIIKQNDLESSSKNFKLKILRKTVVINKKFNLILEADSSTYNFIINKQKLNLGWNRCFVYNDYGIIRCYKCNKYGHFQKDCQDKITCGKCTGNHNAQECVSNCVKCINCVLSNEKYKMNLNVNHTVWDNVNCETYKRIEKIRKNKFLQ